MAPAIGVRNNTSTEGALQDFNGEILHIGDANDVKNGYLNIREGFETALKL